eukprot:4637896-Lingulodinium_polyedra.AAC.1
MAAYSSTPPAARAMSARRPARSRHFFAARAALRTRRVSSHGRSSGLQPPGARGLGAHSSRSPPRPSARIPANALATGPPRR